MDRHILAAKAIISDLLDYTVMQPYRDDEFPTTCGACGTPAASCDTDCVDAANMSKHNALIRRAKKFLEEASEK